MKKIIGLALFLLLFVQVAQAQEPVQDKVVYLPVILSNLECMSNGWQFVAPVATTNLVSNPSGETTGNFAAVGAATVTQVSTFQKYGLQSYRVQTSLNGQGLQLTLGSTLTNQNYYAQARVRGKLPNKWGFILKASPYVEPFLLEDYGDGWKLYGLSFDGSRANGSTFLRIGQIGPGSGDFYVDGIQVEAQSQPTTYCDGTQPGCAWDGAANASTSTRSGQSRAGGKPQDLYDDYGFFVERVVGAGSVTPTIGLDPYALLPGAELNSIKLEPRHFTLVGKFIADSEQELHDNRQALITALAADSFPDNQPVILRFFGARVPKQISVYYQGGLEGDLAAFYNKTFAPAEDSKWEDTSRFVEKATIQFVAVDPMWYEIGESASTLSSSVSATFRTIAARLNSTGQWSPLGPPGAGGSYNTVWAIAEDATYLYIGGDFLNWDGIAAADNIVRYNKQTGVYSAMSNGLNDIVYAIAVAPNGNVYIGGKFLNADGVAAADYLTVWNGTSFAAVGVPNTGTAAITNVKTLCFGVTGILYIGGNFTNWNNIGAADQIVSWDGTAYAALSTGKAAGGDPDFHVWTIVNLPNGDIAIGGDFVGFAAEWNGSAFTTLGANLDNVVASLMVDSSGVLWAAGQFTVPVLGLARFTGSTWVAAGSGLSGGGGAVSGAVDSNNNIYVGGAFTSAGGLTVADRVAIFNGYAWSPIDFDFPGNPNVRVIFSSRFLDPVTGQSNIYFGFNTTGTGVYAGSTATVSNGGSSSSYPKIIFTRSGGTTATIIQVKNETTDLRLLFNYSLLDGETLTIDLNPKNKTVISNFFGSRLDAILPQSDFGAWSLQPGNNNITNLVATSGSPTVTVYLLWVDNFKSYD